MTHDEIVRALADIEQALSERVDVWRVILNPDGTVIGRIYTGSFQRRRESQDKGGD